MQKIKPLLILMMLLMLVVFDSKHHFDAEMVSAKLKHNSAQRHWSLFYPQNHVYYSSSFRYELDFEAINNLVEPGYVVISDVATSYYAAASLPLYVRNIHLHQGLGRAPGWYQFLSSRVLCYIEHQENYDKASKFFKKDIETARDKSIGQLRYIIVNTDRLNRNLKTDCLAFRSKHIVEHLSKIAKLKYDGEFLKLFEFNAAES